MLVFCGHRSVKEIERYDFAKGPAAKITASRVNDHEFGCGDWALRGKRTITPLVSVVGRLRWPVRDTPAAS